MDDARRLNVLLVDDRTAHPLSHAAILGGLDLVRVRLGAETLARLAEREFAVIVLDVNLPGIDGFETAASIRRQPRFAKTPIVLVSDVAVTDADQLHGCQPGAFGEVCVPAVPETLRSKVQALAELHDRRKKLEDLDCNAAQAADGARGLAAPDETSASASARLARKNVMTLRELDGRGRGETTLHDGTVRVSSAGARQEELAASLSAGDPPEPSSPAQAARGTTSPCVRRRVLGVDDDRDSAESLAVLLAMLGHEVEQAYDGPAALAAVRRGAPDLVLLDLAMPGMSGYEVARRMRADNGSSKTVLIALTGYGADEDLRAAREAGFDGHLVKPIDFSALERILAGFPRR